MNYIITIRCGTCNKRIASGDTIRKAQDNAAAASIILPDEEDGHVFHHRDCAIKNNGKFIRNPEKMQGREQYKRTGKFKRGENDGDRNHGNRTTAD